MVLVDDNVPIESKKEWWQKAKSAREMFEKARDQYLELDDEFLGTKEKILQETVEMEDILASGRSKIVGLEKEIGEGRAVMSEETQEVLRWMLDRFGYDMVWAFLLENRDNLDSQPKSQIHFEISIPPEIYQACKQWFGEIATTSSSVCNILQRAREDLRRLKNLNKQQTLPN